MSGGPRRHLAVTAVSRGLHHCRVHCLGTALFWASLAFSLIAAFFATMPLNRWLIGRGKGHALLHAHHQSPAGRRIPGRKCRRGRSGRVVQCSGRSGRVVRCKSRLGLGGCQWPVEEAAREVDASCPRHGSAEGEPHEISAGADTQLLVGVTQMELDSSPAQEQLSGHVGVGVPAADQGGDLLLLRSQLQ
jgi:hypothetical protein